MPSRNREPLLRTSCFDVVIGEREFGFAEVSRFTSETTIDEPSHRRLHRFAPVVLRRALTDSRDLYDWRRRIIDGKADRRDVMIRQRSAPGGRVVNAWRLVGAWPSRWSGPAFDALTDDIAFEELELVFDDLVWVVPDPTKGA